MQSDAMIALDFLAKVWKWIVIVFTIHVEIDMIVIAAEINIHLMPQAKGGVI